MKFNGSKTRIIVFLIFIACSIIIGKWSGIQTYKNNLLENFLKPETSTSESISIEQLSGCFTDSVTINNFGGVTQITCQIPDEGIYNLFITKNTVPVRSKSAIEASLTGFLEGRIQASEQDVQITKRDFVKFGDHSAIEYEYSANQSGVFLIYKGLFFQMQGAKGENGITMDDAYNISVVCLPNSKDIVYNKYEAMKRRFLAIELH